MEYSNISLLYPSCEDITFNEMSPSTFHDLGLDLIVQQITQKESEQKLITGIMSKLTDNPAVAKYRIDVFDDIYNNPQMHDELMEILDKINFLKDYGSFSRRYNDGPSVWDLLHRLEEIYDYIASVEGIHECLKNADIYSQGLLDLKAFVEKVYSDQAFGQLKKDIEACKASTKNLKSVTVGINLNEQFEAQEIGLISINDKAFTKSPLISNFYEKLSGNDIISDSTDWDESMKFSPFTASSDVIGSFEKLTNKSLFVSHPLLMSSLGSIPEGDSVNGVTYYMNSITNRLLSHTTKRLREILNKYVTITITDITNLIPEFIYYIKWAEYIASLRENGAVFSKAKILTPVSDDATSEDFSFYNSSASGIYNIKLVAFDSKEHADIITNDFSFSRENLCYILTGANRGGKTTITQAIGQLFALAQGGIYIPGDSFSFSPVDNIFTHFPADEDKTMDLGRLGEECKRFKLMFNEATPTSLLLLNETFSTTSFEEGYYIAKDSVKAILHKGIRTIYNTHMHKLAFDIDELNASDIKGQAKSLVVISDNGNRSYKIQVAPPIGQSYAKDIAEKYGVTYEMLTDD